MRKVIKSSTIRDAVQRAFTRRGVCLTEDVSQALEAAAARQKQGTPAAAVMGSILENLATAEEPRFPMCQDTGMAVVFALIGADVELDLSMLEKDISDGVAAAYTEGYFRKSIVSDPVFARTNTGNNLPVILYLELVPGDQLTLDIMMKGFGSENCSGLVMANPTAGAGGVADAVVEIVTRAGGKPCPPVVVGVGVGGTADRALLLSKKALLRKLDDTHPDERYAALELDILDRVNALGIGPGGWGGETTALAVKVMAESTHIAGMPVGVSISCWADRKERIILSGE